MTGYSILPQLDGLRVRRGIPPQFAWNHTRCVHTDKDFARAGHGLRNILQNHARRISRTVNLPSLHRCPLVCSQPNIPSKKSSIGLGDAYMQWTCRA